MLQRLILLVLTLFTGCTAASVLAKPLPQYLSPKMNVARTIPLIGEVSGEMLGFVIPAMAGAETPSKTPIDLLISSPGGSVQAGFLIITVMEDIRSRGTKFRCFVPDIAASMAFQILLHCDERYVGNRALLLFHRVRVMLGEGAVLTGPDASALSKDLYAVDRMIWGDLRKHLPLTRESTQYHFDHETAWVAANLCAASPGAFRCYEVLDGVVPYLFALILGPKGEASDGEEAEDDSATIFAPGTIVYMAPPEKMVSVGGN